MQPKLDSAVVQLYFAQQQQQMQAAHLARQWHVNQAIPTQLTPATCAATLVQWVRQAQPQVQPRRRRSHCNPQCNLLTTPHLAPALALVQALLLQPQGCHPTAGLLVAQRLPRRLQMPGLAQQQRALELALPG